MKLSRTVAYAVKATLHLARSSTTAPIPCSQLAADGNMPERFLLQILRNLVTHGILRSSRGVDGGYTLIKAPEEVSLLDIIEAIEGPMAQTDALGEGFTEETGTRLNAALSEVTDTARRQLEAITFSQLLKAPDAPSPEIDEQVGSGKAGDSASDSSDSDAVTGSDATGSDSTGSDSTGSDATGQTTPDPDSEP